MVMILTGYAYISLSAISIKIQFFHIISMKI